MADLTNAISNASDGDTIKLTANITDVSSVIEIKDKEITLDLNGKTISGNVDGSFAYLILVTSGDLTVKDSGSSGKIENACRSAGTGGIRCSTEGTLTISGGTFSGWRAVHNGGTTEIIDGTF